MATSNIFNIYIEARRGIMDIYNIEQIKVIDKIILQYPQELIGVIACPFNSADRMNLLVEAVEAGFKMEWITEIACTGYDDDEAEVVFNYYELQHRLECRNTQTAHPNTQVAKNREVEKECENINGVAFIHFSDKTK